MFLRASTAVFFIALLAHAQPQNPRPQSVLMIQGLGQGQVKLNGFWQFRTGDDLNWASSSLDDSKWRPITASSPWGTQEHPGYTGFAWYRRHLDLSRVSGANTTYSLLIPPVDDAYEVYWNGRFIGAYGKLPPHPNWHYTSFSRAYPLPSVQSGVLAIRVWKSPLLFVDPGSLGGMNGLPLLGDTDSIAAQMAVLNSGLHSSTCMTSV